MVMALHAKQVWHMDADKAKHQMDEDDMRRTRKILRDKHNTSAL
jgi:hypothetical protein